MPLFKVLADAAEEGSKLGAQAIDVARRTQDGVLDATGVNSVLPTSAKNLADGAYRANEKVVLTTGHEGAEVLRKIDKGLEGRGSSQQNDNDAPKLEQGAAEDVDADSSTADPGDSGSGDTPDDSSDAEGDNAGGESDHGDTPDDAEGDDAGGESDSGDTPDDASDAEGDDGDSESDSGDTSDYACDSDEDYIGSDSESGDDNTADDAESPYAVPSSPDSRDYKYKSPQPKKPHGRHVDLRQKCPPVYDQLRLGSCTANAVAGAFEFEAMKQNLPLFSPSRLFIWYNARAKSGVASAVKRNVGCSLRNAIQSLNLKGHGVCSESEWPYEAAEYNKKTLYFTDPKARAATKPPAVVVQHAHLHAVSRYYAFTKDKNLLTKLLHCLDEGYPFLFGTPTYKLFSKVGKDGRGLPVPTAQDRKNTPGGHALLVVGYIHEEKVFIVRNSWGENWGEKGYFYMPYGWLKYAYDLWTIRVVTDTDKRKGTKKNDAKQKSTKA